MDGVAVASRGTHTQSRLSQSFLRDERHEQTNECRDRGPAERGQIGLFNRLVGVRS
jgi:hypothetical protein